MNDLWQSLVEFYAIESCNIQTYLDKNEVTAGDLIDLRKAFDTADHDILLAKRDNYGIWGVANDWFF